jgi:energy-coupling factor transporter ATP-binding protein EcfA2
MAITLKSTKQAAMDGIKCLVHGPSGSGKTTLCSTTGEPTIIISAESGLLSLRGFDIPVLEVKTLDELYEAYAYVAGEAGAQYSWVCLDSISEIAEVVLNHEKKTAKDPRQAYGSLAEKMTDLIRAFRDLPGRNVLFLCKQEKSKDEQTGAMLYGPSMPGNQLKNGLAYFFDEVLALRVEKDAEGNPTRWLQAQRDYNYESKDRSGALDMFEQPNIANIAAKIRGAVSA